MQLFSAKNIILDTTGWGRWSTGKYARNSNTNIRINEIQNPSRRMKRTNFSKFSKRFRRKRPALFKSGQWHFLRDNTPVDNSMRVTDYLTKMGIKTLPQPPYSPDLALCDFWLFPKLGGCRYETIEEMKEAVAKVIDTLTQEDFHGAFKKLLDGTTSEFQPGEITWKGTGVSCVYCE